jgi:hypothetical protein
MTDEPRYQSPFRLAFRGEGEFVNCYFADNDTLAEAILVGSLRLAVVEKHPEAFEQFKELMTQVLISACRDAIGVEPAFFHEYPAPEHEREKRT